MEKALELVKIHTKPIYVFREVLFYLENKRIVIPGYSTMQDIVGQALVQERQRLEARVRAYLSEEDKATLNRLLKAEQNLYKLTLLKKEPKDFGYKETRLEIARLTGLKSLYQAAQTFLPKLSISNENSRYYASLVGYYTVQKLTRPR